MDKTRSLHNLLNNTASEEDVELLKRLLTSGEISIGGNVNQSVIIIGSGNTVELPLEALDRLNARPMLGNLERDLTGEEIAAGLERLEYELPFHAPILLIQFQEQARRLRPSLKTSSTSLSELMRKERVEALAVINSLCMEALDISFNALCLGEEPPEYDTRSPFRGLESFRPEDSEFFFGREALTQKLIGKIKAHSFLAVLGASGSGKSSLVMAGVIPALDLDYAIIRPGISPLVALESAHGKSLLVVDQFEELFTLTRDERTRADFISALLGSTRSGRVIITLRSDFLGEAGAYRSLSGEIQNHLEIISPMNADELRRAMEGQARWARLEFEADLSQQILEDVASEPGAMPLLQHALWELWNRRHGRHLRANEYRAFGGVKLAITSTAEKAYGECSKSEQEQVRDIFLRLTRLDEGNEGRDTRHRVPLGDLIPSGADPASISALLDKLANARLIVKTVNGNVTEVEVAHEALIRHWERLRIWLNEDRDNLRLRESVSESAKEWENAHCDESLINHRGPRLELALAMSKNPRYQLNPIEQAYLEACVRLREKDKKFIETQEVTRKKLARDIHDETLSPIAAVAMRVNLARLLIDRDVNAAKEELEKIQDLAIRITEESRHVLFNLRPLVLESQGLKVALQVMADKMKETYEQEVIIQVDEKLIGQLEMEKTGIIFYISEEAVNNARKHAHASHIWVRLNALRKQPEIAHLEIEDDGNGFDVSSIMKLNDKRGSLGMINLRERAKLLNGVLNVISFPGEGTRVQLYIPLTDNASKTIHSNQFLSPNNNA